MAVDTEAREARKWFSSPQNLVATATIVTMILGFFYVRERQMWEMSNRISALEGRGEKAITDAHTRFSEVNARFGVLESSFNSLRDQINFIERKIDHTEFNIKELMEDRGNKFTPSWDKPGPVR